MTKGDILGVLLSNERQVPLSTFASDRPWQVLLKDRWWELALFVLVVPAACVVAFQSLVQEYGSNHQT